MRNKKLSANNPALDTERYGIAESNPDAAAIKATLARFDETMAKLSHVKAGRKFSRDEMNER